MKSGFREGRPRTPMERYVQHGSIRLLPGPAVVFCADRDRMPCRSGRARGHRGPHCAARRGGWEGLLGAAEGAALWRDRARCRRGSLTRC